jgi:hypothetical protein
MPKQTPKQIHKQYDVFGDDIKVNINHQYVKAPKEWKFVGYRCSHCDSGFKFVSSLLKHKNNCKVLNRIKDDKNANTDDNS